MICPGSLTPLLRANKGIGPECPHCGERVPVTYNISPVHATTALVAEHEYVPRLADSPWIADS